MFRYSDVIRRVYFAGIALLFLPALGLAQTSYTIKTIAGTGVPGYGGDGASPTSAQLNSPIQVAVDASHNLYIADSANQRVRKISGGQINTFAGTGTAGYSGDGGPATKAMLYTPYGVMLDSAGNVYIADLYNIVVRKVTPDGNIATIAGNNTPGFLGDGGPATSAQLYFPFGMAVDAAGNFYVADSTNQVIRMVAPDGTISTFAGSAKASGFAGDGGPANRAKLNEPFGIAIDAAGNLYIADSGNNRIRKVAPNGIITTVAGTGVSGFSGDGGPAGNAQLKRPFDVAVDPYGNLFIADYNNYRIREVSVNGIINTVAGGSTPGYAGDNGPALSSRLNNPSGVAVDNVGNVYIADSGNNAIRMLTPSTPTVSSGGVITAYDFGASPSVAPGSWIEIYGTGMAFGARSWAGSDFSGVNAPTALDGTSVTIGGQAAFLDYISGGQVNAQVPSTAGTGQQQIVVKSAAGTSAAYTVTVNATQPGLYAPVSFKTGGKQYVWAQFTDGKSYALPAGAISGVTSRRANPGETITMYGVGFGPVTPNIPAGQIVPQLNTLALPLQISIGGLPATASYSGLAPGQVGLYQFNVVVPNVPADDAAPVTFTLGGTAGTQTLYIAVN